MVERANVACLISHGQFICIYFSSFLSFPFSVTHFYYHHSDAFLSEDEKDAGVRADWDGYQTSGKRVYVFGKPTEANTRQRGKGGRMERQTRRWWLAMF